MKKLKNIWLVFVVLGMGAPAGAQSDMKVRTQDPAARAAMERSIEKQEVLGEMRAKMAVEARVTPGAPYTADAVTESTQVLGDGNRISRKSLTRVYRDGEGRTRREEVNEAGTVVSVSIVDPVAHVSYVLQPQTRTAYREAGQIRFMAMRSKVEAGADRLSDAPPPPPPPPPPASGALLRTPAPEMRMRVQSRAPEVGDVTHEDLGQQDVEGVSATGTRISTMFPAGAIGNLQPLKVVSEQWFSPDLQLLVLTKHSDPRSGETTYRLQNIVRAEPDRSLFSVPADYTLKASDIRQPQPE
jgi:hypothetical protein